MPLLNALGFAEKNLTVRYRASIESQLVDIHIKTAKPACEPSAGADLTILGNQVCSGVAGGRRFDPALGSWERLAGVSERDEGPEACGPEYRWKCRIAAVDPIFMRSIVEGLRGCGLAPNNPVREMSILGEFPPDGSDLSVTEDHVRAWLDDPRAYVGEWPKPGFPIAQMESRGIGVTLRVQLQRNATADELDWLEGCAGEWVNTLSNYVSEDGKQIRFDVGFLPKISRSKRELSAHYQDFRWTRIPARAVIVNLLSRYHATFVPLAGVELSL